MKQRKHKFSLGIKIASILSCIALISVGFASWWIIKMPEAVTEDGSFTVYAVEEKNVEFKNVTLANSEIIFGKVADVDETWLWAMKEKDGTEMANENLKSTLTFTVDLKDGGTDLSESSTLNDMLSEVTLTVEPSAAAALEAAINANYIKNPTVTYKYTPAGGTEQTGTVAYEENGEVDKIVAHIDMSNAKVNTVTVTVEIAFEWGSAFNATIDETTQNWNPYVYYNNKTYDATAKTALDTLNTLSGATYDVTIAAVPAR